MRRLVENWKLKRKNTTYNIIKRYEILRNSKCGKREMRKQCQQNKDLNGEDDHVLELELVSLKGELVFFFWIF